MQDFREVEYENGDRRLIAAPPIRRSYLIRALYSQLTEEMQDIGLGVWPPDHVIDERSLCEWYAYLFSDRFCRLSLLFQREDEPLGTDWLTGVTAESIHYFFVGTQPVQHWQQDKLIPGLPLILQLLGDAYPTSGARHDSTVPTTGCRETDILSALCLSFEGTAAGQWDEDYCVDFLGKLLKQAGELRERAMAEAKKEERKHDAPTLISNPTPEAEDDARFIENKVEIVSKLTAMGIPIPTEF